MTLDSSPDWHCVHTYDGDILIGPDGTPGLPATPDAAATPLDVPQHIDLQGRVVRQQIVISARAVVR